MSDESGITGELKLNWSRGIRLWSEFFWRSFLMGIAAVCINLFLSFAFRILAGQFPSLAYFWMIGLVLKLLVICAASFVSLMWLFGKRFGDFRVVLVKAVPSTSTSPGSVVDKNEPADPNSYDY